MLKYKEVIRSKSDAEYAIHQSLRITDIEESSEVVNKIAREAKINMLVDDWVNLANWANEKYPKEDIPYRMLSLYIKTIPLRNELNGSI